MKVRLMIIIGVISFLLGGCNKIQKNSNQVQLVQRTEEISLFYRLLFPQRLPREICDPVV